MLLESQSDFNIFATKLARTIPTQIPFTAPVLIPRTHLPYLKNLTSSLKIFFFVGTLSITTGALASYEVTFFVIY